jgi:hypothetical protein
MSKSRVQLNIPYFSSWESPELVRDLIARKIEAKNDPKWRNSGAENAQEYDHWSWNVCGITCFRMILAAEEKPAPKMMDLVRIAVENKCLDTDKGLYYKPFCVMAKKIYAIDAHFTESLTLERIRREVRKGNYVIASVHGTIREESLDFDPPKKGGHLVLITGFDQTTKMIQFHDPSGYFNSTQQYREVSESDFLRFASGRGLIIYSHIHEKREN